MKRTWTALLLALALCLQLAVPALAATPDKDGFTIDAEGVLTKYTGSGGHIVLPAGVKKIGYGAFDRCSTLSSVVIPSGVTYIGINAFRNCIALTKVTFPDTLTEIDGGAFSGCISLTAVDLPDSVTSLGEQGCNFFGCTNLKRVTIGRGLTKLPYTAFGKCTSLLSAVVPENVTTFSWAFQDCPSLTIHGAAGSRAEAYAAESGIPFAADLGAAATVSRFTDVPASSPYAAAILWAVENEITAGLTPTRFGPEEPCTRGQFLTFLWRAHGSPRSNEATHFVDSIPESYKMAVRWAYGMGLVSGSTFGANEPCTRSMAITWLWQLAGNPAAFPDSFQDLPRGSDAFMAASWAVTTNVADKLGDGFSPGRLCTRGEALTYLYRATKKPILVESPSNGRRFFFARRGPAVFAQFFPVRMKCRNSGTLSPKHFERTRTFFGSPRRNPPREAPGPAWAVTASAHSPARRPGTAGINRGCPRSRGGGRRRLCALRRFPGHPENGKGGIWFGNRNP